jgi:hypothetical protein
VYENFHPDAYNSRMRTVWGSICCALLLWANSVSAQASGPEPLSILTKELPPASLWANYGDRNEYGFRLQASGGVAPYHWRVINGVLPRELKLQNGEITGIPDEHGNFQFALELRDSSNPPAKAQKNVALLVEIPFSAEWDRKARVNGQRIDGSVKVSNRTGRDFDLTFVVLAVNDIGRATAIGYQHFPLKRNTRDFPLPFGDNLSPGNYTVNIDLVAEEPVSNRIFRARLVTEKESITQGP